MRRSEEQIFLSLSLPILPQTDEFKMDIMVTDIDITFIIGVVHGSYYFCC